MTNNALTTPSGVPETPFLLPAPLVAFDGCLALTRDAIAADAAVENWYGDPALTLFGDGAANALAMVDNACETFHRAGYGDAELNEAVWLLMLLFEDDGRDLDLLEQRTWHVRHDALTCASSGLPYCQFKAARLWAAADLLEQLIDLARADAGPTSCSMDDLNEIGVRRPDADIDRVDGFTAAASADDPARRHSARPDTDPETDFEQA